MRNTKLERFQNTVIEKFNLYNSVFSTLPYSEISNTANLLPFFSNYCEKGFDENKNPTEIVNDFFEHYFKDYSTQERVDLLFRFIQFIERQVVLFDAIEDAAFSEVNNLNGLGTLRNIKEQAEQKGKNQALKKYLNQFKVRPVLTAHPTQFYPGSVLAIITDLVTSIQDNDLGTIKMLLSQLGRTPFFKKEKPTPFDEAKSLIWYLENVFYHSISTIHYYIQTHIFDEERFDNSLINLGFWPGGDRDGNPFVTTQITLNTAQSLRSSIIRNYYRDIRKLRRRLTFKKVEPIVIDLERRLYRSIFITTQEPRISLPELKEKLNLIYQTLENDYHGLFLKEVKIMINKVEIFIVVSLNYIPIFHCITIDIFVLPSDYRW